MMMFILARLTGIKCRHSEHNVCDEWGLLLT